jgi:hypothetical protein
MRIAETGSRKKRCSAGVLLSSLRIGLSSRNLAQIKLGRGGEPLPGFDLATETEIDTAVTKAILMYIPWRV